MLSLISAPASVGPSCGPGAKTLRVAPSGRECTLTASRRPIAPGEDTRRAMALPPSAVWCQWERLARAALAGDGERHARIRCAGRQRSSPGPSPRRAPARSAAGGRWAAPRKPEAWTATEWPEPPRLQAWRRLRPIRRSRRRPARGPAPQGAAGPGARKAATWATSRATRLQVTVCRRGAPWEVPPTAVLKTSRPREDDANRGVTRAAAGTAQADG